MGAKLAWFAKSATAPLATPRELKPNRKVPRPGGRGMPAVTPRSTEAVSRPSLRKVQSVLAMRELRQRREAAGQAPAKVSACWLPLKRALLKVGAGDGD